MNTMKVLFVVTVSAISASAPADWHFNIGHAWRSKADVSFQGAGAQISPGGIYQDGHVNLGATAEDGFPDWSGPIGSVQSRTVTAENDYTLVLTRGGPLDDRREESSGHGLTASIGYDLCESERFSLAATLRFAGYFGMEQSFIGGYALYQDTFRFTGLLDGIDDSPDRTRWDEPDAYVGRELLAGGSIGRMAICSDLYQIGLGAEATWRPFAERNDRLSRIDVYGGVEVLCNVSRSEFEAGDGSASKTDRFLGLGLHVGLLAHLAEDLLLYGQVGYEWMDKTSLVAGDYAANVDYSTFVTTVGLEWRF